MAELERHTDISSVRLRRMKEHNFEDTDCTLARQKVATTPLSGYTGILDNLLQSDVVNSAVCLERLCANNSRFGGKVCVQAMQQQLTK